MKLKLGFLLFLCPFIGIQAQDKIIKNTTSVLNNTGITVGQKVPDILIRNITGLNVGNKSVTALPLSNFKGKLLILDFFATWCAPCIAMNPRMELLQEQFNGRVQFLPVAYQSYQEVNTFFQKLEKQTGKYPSLPMVTADTVLVRLFPHHTLPHYVWINGDGIVKAITDRQAITAENITKLLAAGALPLRIKQDEQLVYNPSEPLFFTGKDFGDGLFRSQLSGYITGVGRGMYKDVQIQSDEPIRRITARNLTITELFRLAYQKEQKETLLETTDAEQLEPKKLAGADFLDWLKQGRGYCYELMVPEQSKNNAYFLMQNQLKGFFSDYHIGLEKRKVNCLALVRTSATDKLLTSGGEASAYLDGFGCKFKSCYLSVFLGRMQVPLQGNPLPLIDETGYKAMADLELTANMSNLDDINKALARYDLQFVEKQADIEMLVIRNR